MKQYPTSNIPLLYSAAKLEGPLLVGLLNILFCRSKCLLFVLQGNSLTLHYNPNKEALICKIASDVSRCNKPG